MSEAERLFSKYVEEHRAGGAADPRAYLRRAPAGERRELAALIDSYLARSPRQEFKLSEVRGSSAERTVDELERALGGQAGLWPALLPRLRDRAGLKRSQLVERLAKALGVSTKAGKVGAYYHQMEQGTLPAQGVSNRVLDAIGQIVGENAQALRDAGRSLGEGPAPAPAAEAFARRASAEASAATSQTGAPKPRDRPAWDEVDQLFRGG